MRHAPFDEGGDAIGVGYVKVEFKIFDLEETVMHGVVMVEKSVAWFEVVLLVERLGGDEWEG